MTRNNVQTSKWGQIPITQTHRRSSSDANTVFYVGKQALTSEAKEPREILAGDMFWSGIV